MRTLLLSGFGTAICGNSQPASQGEHLISHYIDMLRRSGLARLLPWRADRRHHPDHGAPAGGDARGRGTGALADPPDEAALIRYFGPELGASCWAEFAKKAMDAAQTGALNAKLKREWPEIRDALRQVVRPSAEMEAALRPPARRQGRRYPYTPGLLSPGCPPGARDPRSLHLPRSGSGVGRLDSLAAAA